MSLTFLPSLVTKSIYYNRLNPDQKMVFRKYVYGLPTFSRYTHPIPQPFELIPLLDTKSCVKDVKIIDDIVNMLFKKWNHTTYAIGDVYEPINNTISNEIVLDINWWFCWSSDDQVFLNLADREDLIISFRDDAVRELSELITIKDALFRPFVEKYMAMP